MDVGAGKAAMSKVVPGFPSTVRSDVSLAVVHIQQLSVDCADTTAEFAQAMMLSCSDMRA